MRQPPQYKLDPRIKRVWLITDLLGDLVIALICGVIAAFVSLGISYVRVSATLTAPASHGLRGLAVFALMFVVLAVITVVFLKIRYRIWSYDITATEIDIQSGYIVKKRTIIPFVRVQSVSTEQGPILKMNGLAEVKVTTASSSHHIPGLTLEDAEQVRDRVAVLSRIAQEDV